MIPFHRAGGVSLYLGDCREVVPSLGEIDAIVTDPPYGLEFMGKGWDGAVPGVAFWKLALAAAKPGAHLLAFGGTRTFHRLACAIEDAGWEIRDCLTWLHGQGFPKSLDVSKAIDAAAGVEGERGAIKSDRHAAMIRTGRVGAGKNEGWQRAAHTDPEAIEATAREYLPATDEARAWKGWGTSLKPAWEPIILARKPLVGTVAANVLAHGTGAINVDGCRIGETVETWPSSRSYAPGQMQPGHVGATQPTGSAPPGRWPANVVLDEEAARTVDEQSGELTSGSLTADQQAEGGFRGAKNCYGSADRGGSTEYAANRGGASRFFFVSRDPCDSPDPYALGAALRCASCGTVTALAHARADLSREKSARGPESTDGSGSSIQTQSLASSAERRAGTATTPTTPTFCGSCGSALHAIGAHTNSEGAARAAGGRGPEQVTRFLYSPKASSSERGSTNDHPTVKPLDLMRWLVRLVTPKGGLVLDPFAGSGTTLLAAREEDCRAIGIEREEKYCAIAKRRLAQGVLAWESGS